MSKRTSLAGSLCLALELLVSAAVRADDKIRVAVGTQDTTINCATGGPLVRELHLLEKYLPHTGKYQGVEYEIHWENQPTGAQLNSKYLANQLDIVQMADFPSVLGATAFATAGGKVESFYIANLSGGIKGAGNAILVPSDSPVQSLSELKGRKLSVPSPVWRKPIRRNTAAEAGLSVITPASSRSISRLASAQRASRPAASVATPWPQNRRPTQ